MKRVMTLILCITMFWAMTACGTNTEANLESNSEPQTMVEPQATIPEVYAFTTEEGDFASYYVIDFEQGYIYMFHADEYDDSCFALPIEAGNLEDGLTASISDGYSMVPFTMHYKDANQTERVVMTIEGAYEVELVATSLEEALMVKEGKTIVELNVPEDSEELDAEEVYTAEGQIGHRSRITDKEERIEAVIKDIEMGSGETISYERAVTMEESLDVYSDSSADIKKAYKNPDSPYRELMEALDEYLNHSVKWYGTVTRGAVATKEEAEKIISGEEPVDMFGPSSWTSDEVIAQNYARDKASGDDSSVGIVYVLEENKSGVSITHLSRYGTSEGEVLAPSGVLYMVDSYETISVDSVDLLYVYVHEAE